MKTAMQELLDITYNSIHNAKLLKDNGMNDPREIDILLNLYNVYRVIIEKNMLEKEKEQIAKAWDERAKPYPYEGSEQWEVLECTGEQYYNFTYNQNN